MSILRHEGLVMGLYVALEKRWILLGASDMFGFILGCWLKSRIKFKFFVVRPENISKDIKFSY